MLVDLMWEGNRGVTFSLEEALLWMMDLFDNFFDYGL